VSINKNVLKKNCPPVGEQIRIDHEGCSAGTDTKKRLYIKVPEDNPGIIIGYCHHCGESGVARTNSRYYAKSLRTHTDDPDQPITVPSDAEFDPTAWPVVAKAFLGRNSLDRDDVESLGLAYVPSQGRVLIPCGFIPVNIEAGIKLGPQTGYQLRKLVNNEKLPKYITVAPRGGLPHRPIYGGRGIDNVRGLIICEDVISAHKLHNAGVDAMPLFGAEISKDKLFLVSRQYPDTRIGVWLDNDNSQIRRRAKKYYNFLDLTRPRGMSKLFNGTDTTDPKHYTRAELRDKLIAMDIEIK